MHPWGARPVADTSPIWTHGCLMMKSKLHSCGLPERPPVFRYERLASPPPKDSIWVIPVEFPERRGSIELRVCAGVFPLDLQIHALDAFLSRGLGEGMEDPSGGAPPSRKEREHREDAHPSVGDDAEADACRVSIDARNGEPGTGPDACEKRAVDLGDLRETPAMSRDLEPLLRAVAIDDGIAFGGPPPGPPSSRRFESKTGASTRYPRSSSLPSRPPGRARAPIWNVGARFSRSVPALHPINALADGHVTLGVERPDRIGPAADSTHRAEPPSGERLDLLRGPCVVGGALDRLDGIVRGHRARRSAVWLGAPITARSWTSVSTNGAGVRRA